MREQGAELLPIAMLPLCETGAELLSMPALLEPEVGLLSMPPLHEQGAELLSSLPCFSKECRATLDACSA
jgi:hypothetical protein